MFVRVTTLLRIHQAPAHIAAQKRAKLSDFLFTDHPTILRYTVRATEDVIKCTIHLNVKLCVYVP